MSRVRPCEQHPVAAGRASAADVNVDVHPVERGAGADSAAERAVDGRSPGADPSRAGQFVAPWAQLIEYGGLGPGPRPVGHLRGEGEAARKGASGHVRGPDVPGAELSRPGCGDRPAETGDAGHGRTPVSRR